MIGLSPKYRYSRLLELGFVKVRGETEVMALEMAERRVREEGRVRSETEVRLFLMSCSSVKDVRLEKAAGSMVCRLLSLMYSVCSPSQN